VDDHDLSGKACGGGAMLWPVHSDFYIG
jgi:hypothetical protein